MSDVSAVEHFIEAGGVHIIIKGEFDFDDDPIFCLDVHLENVDSESIHKARFLLSDRFGLLTMERMGASSHPADSNLHLKKP